MKVLKILLKFLQRWSELLALPLAFLLFKWSDPLIRWIDPTAATYDLGVFQIFFVAMVAFFLFTGLSWLYMRIVFPKGYNILDNIFRNSDSLTEWQSAKLALSLFAVLLFALVFLARIL